jgi:hypothetical protein
MNEHFDRLKVFLAHFPEVNCLCPRLELDLRDESGQVITLTEPRVTILLLIHELSRVGRGVPSASQGDSRTCWQQDIESLTAILWFGGKPGVRVTKYIRELVERELVEVAQASGRRNRLRLTRNGIVAVEKIRRNRILALENLFKKLEDVGDLESLGQDFAASLEAMGNA